MTSNNRPLSTYPIPPSILSKLNKAGFMTANSVLGLRPAELCTNATISVEEAVDILQLLGQPNGTLFRTRTAFEILQEELSFNPIYTMSQKVDNLFDGGVPLSKVTEISGIAGVGKTQFCLQLCVTVQLPAECAGVQGQAVYVDTEGSFNVSRLEDMSRSCISHCQAAMKLERNSWNLDSIIENVFVFRCKEITELISCVMLLKEFLRTHPKVKLIVVDSLAFHFRHDMENAALRSRVLHKIASQLSNLAIEFKAAVVVTNQMTTKFDSAGEGHLTPALGTSWGHAPTFRLLLDWDPSRAFRWATLIKSSCMPPGCAPYQVTKDGIRDVVLSRQATPPRVVNEDGIPGIRFDA